MGDVILVSDDDVDLLAAHRWRVGQKGYVTHSDRDDEGKQHFPKLHRLIAQRMLGDVKLTSDALVLFRNEDRADCRRENLEIVGVGDVVRKYPKRQGKTSQYKGVYREKMPYTNPWRAAYTKDSVREDLGHFHTEVDAARAFDDRYEQDFGIRPNKTAKTSRAG